MNKTVILEGARTPFGKFGGALSQFTASDLGGDSFVLREKQNIKANDQKKIESVIGENKDIIIKRWKEHFEK